jgi:hypothetical protein
MQRITSRLILAATFACGLGLICVVVSDRAARLAAADQTTSAASQPDLGPNASLHGRQIFPPDNPWNRDISSDPVDPKSDAIIATIGSQKPLHPDFGSMFQGQPFGIPYVVVSGDQPKVPVAFGVPDESDPGPYPIPPDAPIEGGPDSTGDRHVLVIDRDRWMLYELFSARPVDGGKSWTAAAGAIFNLSSNDLRPSHWTSADAAGLPILPGLVRYDEVMDNGRINHALRFSVRRTRASFLPPARHFASRSFNPNLPPMGMRVRLKASFEISDDYPASAQVILKALKQYGMFVADNGGNWFLSGAPDPRWNDDEIQTLKHVHGGDFEVIKMSQ